MGLSDFTVPLLPGPLDEVYGDLPEIRQKLWEAFKAGAFPKETMPYYDQDVIDFIETASQVLRASKQ